MSGNPIVQGLVRLIAEKKLKPGDTIPAELDLCVSLGVSRPVLREAISALEAIGLLTARKGSGRVLMPFNFGVAFAALAQHVTPKSKWLLDLLAIRQVLETNLLPVAASSISPEDYARLEETVAVMEAKALAGAHFAAEDRQFHSLLYGGLNNDVMLGLLNLFWTVYDQIDTDDLAHSQRLDETAAHHRRILAALQEGDIRRAQHHLNTHFYDTSFALSHLADQP